MITPTIQDDLQYDIVSHLCIEQRKTLRKKWEDLQEATNQLNEYERVMEDYILQVKGL